MHSIVISAWSEGEQTMISMLLNAVAEGTLTFWEWESWKDFCRREQVADHLPQIPLSFVHPVAEVIMMGLVH